MSLFFRLAEQEGAGGAYGGDGEDDAVERARGPKIGDVLEQELPRAGLGGAATPEEVADFFVFLCSPRAGYCTGSTYYIDGGWLAGTV